MIAIVPIRKFLKPLVSTSSFPVNGSSVNLTTIDFQNISHSCNNHQQANKQWCCEKKNVTHPLRSFIFSLVFTSDVVVSADLR